VKRLKDDVERRVDALLKRDGKDARPAEEDGAAAPASEGDSRADRDEVKAGVVKEFVHSTTEAFESWQKRIDERVRDAVGKMSAPSGPRPDVDALKARIEALEARIREVEAKRK
jgi:hypothetical protein